MKSFDLVWKQSHGRTTEAPPDERGGNRYVRPKATAPHLDSTNSVARTRHKTSRHVRFSNRPIGVKCQNQTWRRFSIEAVSPPADLPIERAVKFDLSP
jgi:hypothetical protein